MASNVRDPGALMSEALSCPICFLSYDQASRLPKVFACQHTVCLACASQLLQQEYGDVFRCPTCRQSVTIPPQGASGLQTNLAVATMVEIVQGVRTMTNPHCIQHPSKLINNICMNCKVGLCSKCISSLAIRDHMHHEVMDFDDAFQDMKKTCKVLIEKGDSTSNLLIEQGNNIKACAASLKTALQSKDISAFEMMSELSKLLDNPKFINDSVKESGPSFDNLSDERHGSSLKTFCQGKLEEGMSELDKYCHSDALHSMICAKLAALTVQTELLRLKLHSEQTGGILDTLECLLTLSDESEHCCYRFVILDGHSLLLSCIDKCRSDHGIISYSLDVIGNAAEHHTIHNKLISTSMVQVLVHALQSYKMSQRQIPDNACRVLSLFLSNPALVWPKECPSHSETSDLVMHACKSYDINERTWGAYVSLRPHMALLTQQFNEAAKYWAIWTLYRFTNQNPATYRPMLVSEGGVPVLQQLQNSHDYVKNLAQRILKDIS